MNSISNRKIFPIGELMYWTVISFTISLVMGMNYLFLSVSTNGSILYKWVELAIIAIVSGSALMIILSEKPLLRFIAFLLLVSPVAFMLRSITIIPFLERNLLYFGLLPMLLLLMGIFYKKIFSSFLLMVFAFVVAGLLETYLFPVTYKIELIQGIVVFYVTFLLVHIYQGGIKEENKTITNAINILLKVFLWPGYFVKAVFMS